MYVINNRVSTDGDESNEKGRKFTQNVVNVIDNIVYKYRFRIYLGTY